MAALTQRTLAQRLDTTPSVLSRWESGQVEPGFSAVARAVDACGLSLLDVLAEPAVGAHDASLLETTLALTVDERLQRLIAYVQFVQAGREAMSSR
jgi:transcriptional regulator with XRE-family HTH domain